MAGSGIFAGTAWHCYGGDMSSAQDTNHGAFPNAEQHMTECTSNYGSSCDISKGMSNFGWDHEWDMKNLFLGNTARWGQSGMKWISVLNENCGPTLQSMGSFHGKGLIAVPSWASSINDIKFNQDFWTIAHMARFVKRGSRRIASNGERGDALVESFEHEQSQSITLMAYNPDHSNDMQLKLHYGGNQLTYTVPAWGTAVLVWATANAPSPTPSPSPPSPSTPSPTPEPPSAEGQCCFGGCGISCQGGWCGQSQDHCTGNCKGLWCPSRMGANENNWNSMAIVV